MKKKTVIPKEKIAEVLERGVEKIYPSKEALEKFLHSGKKIRVYQGFDPSMPNLHLGNLVGVLKLKQFQDLGCEVIFLVGDFTGMIGDPTDKSSTRKLLTREQVLENSKNWKKQAGKILNFDGENPAKIMFNSQWNDKISFKDLIGITSKFTVQQMIERDFFQERLKAGRPIYLHEFLYPVAQAIDSLEMNVDLEIGGSDQTFNMLCGRTLMKALKGKEKFVLTTKLLTDAKGKKVGKTTGNALFLNASAHEMYGGIMSFPDEVIIPGFELLTMIPTSEIKEMENQMNAGRINPMTLKKRLAGEIVSLLYSEKEASSAQEEFERVFQKGEAPLHDILIYDVGKNSPRGIKSEKVGIIDLLVDSKVVPSRSEAKRLIKHGGVEIEGRKVSDIKYQLSIKDGMIIKIGKRRFIKIRANR